MVLITEDMDLLELRKSRAMNSMAINDGVEVKDVGDNVDIVLAKGCKEVKWFPRSDKRR